jgi:hypothetical protein
MIALVLLGLLVLLGVAAVFGAVADTRDPDFALGRTIAHRPRLTPASRPAPPAAVCH